MLTSIRKPVAKVVTIILFSLLILSFAVWGIGDFVRGSGNTTAVAEVGDVQVEQREFTRNLNLEFRRLQSQLGQRLDMADARALGLVDQVLRQLVKGALIDQKAADLGMVVGQDQITARIVQEPAFQNEFGEFDRELFFRTLRASSLSEQQYVASLSRDIQRGQISGAVTGASLPPAPLVEAIYSHTQERRTAEVVVIESDSIDELPPADDATLQKLHEERSSEFMRPEMRSVTMIYLRAQDFAKEIAVGEEELKAAFEERRDDFAVAERRTIAQILFAEEDAARTAKTALDGGADFAETARQATDQEPIELGTLTKDELALQLPDLAEPVFAVVKGGVTEPINTPFGWHLVRVSDVEPGKEPDFEDAREELAQDLAMRQAVDSLVSIANQLDDELGGGATLEEAAAALDLQTVQVPAIDGQGRDAAGTTIADLPPQQELLPLIAETEAGETSLLNETPEGDYFVLRVDGVTPAEVKPFEEVREQARTLWQQQERDRLARERAETLAERAREGVALSKVAADEGLDLFVRGPVNRLGEGTDVAVSRDLVSRMFELKSGEVTTAREAGGYAVAKLVDIDQPSPAADREGLDAVREALAQNLEGELMAEFAAALSQTYGVSINNRLIEESLSAY